MYRIVLFVLAFLTQRALATCNVCGADGFAITLPDTRVEMGADYLYCSELVSMSNTFDNDQCSIAQAKALATCGCQDYNRSPLPLATINLSTMCNMCGGPNGNDLAKYAPDLAGYNIGAGDLGITATCSFFYTTGLAGAFADYYSCHTLQESARAACSCQVPSVGYDAPPPPVPVPPPPPPPVPVPPPPPVPAPAPPPPAPGPSPQASCLSHGQYCYMSATPCCGSCQMELGEMATCW